MKKIISLLLAMMLVLGCISAASADLLDDVLERGYLMVGTEGTYPPNSYYDENDALVGFDVEVAAAIAQKLGVDVKYYVNSWQSLLIAMDNGQCDTIINEMEYNEERGLKYEFSVPYTYLYGAVLVAEGNDSIHSFDDIAGKRAAQNPASTWSERATGYGATLVDVTGDAETYELILTGRADCTLNAETAFGTYMKEHPEAGVKVAFRTENVLSSSRVPALKGETRFIEAVDKAIAELVEDGTLGALSMKYFGVDLSHE